MNRLFARLIVLVFMSFLAAVGQAAEARVAAGPIWLESPTRCAQCL